MSDRPNRRGLLLRLGRWLALGGLLGGVGALAVRRPSESGKTGETCVNEGLCRGCAAYAGCRLPAALSMRQALDGDRR